MVAEIHPNAKLTPSKPELIGAWAGGQRWFTAKGRTPTLTKVSSYRFEDPAGEVGVEVLFLRDSGDASGTIYQVPVTYRAMPLAGAEHALIGTLDHSVLGKRWVYDGPHDPVFAEALLETMRRGGHEAERSDGVVEMRVVGRPQEPSGAYVASAPMRSSTVLRGEQSNTSIIYTLEDDTQLIAKVFRVLNVGPNPDIEITAALTRAGNRNVPALIASLHGSFRIGRHSHSELEADLAFVQEFMPNVRDAWREALEAAQDETDFTESARQLGRATAMVHRTLAQQLGTTPTSPELIDAIAAGMDRRTNAALEAAPALELYRTDIGLTHAEMHSATWPPMQRIHGDFHLGQVLDVPGRGWVLLDFEGEPLRPIEERNQPDSPIRDVAGMLRSFDYAGGSVEQASPGTSRREWVAATQAAFLSGYEQELDTRVDRAVLDAFVLDKALYEVVYEARNRPTWLTIPVGAVERILVPNQLGVPVDDKRPLATTAVTADQPEAGPTADVDEPALGDAVARTASSPAAGHDSSSPEGLATAAGSTTPTSSAEVHDERSAPTMTSETSHPSPASVHPDELAAIAAGEHRDPHRVLGAHLGEGIITFRVVRPLAKQVSIVMGDERVELRHEQDGIWAGAIAGDAMPDYRIAAQYEGSDEQIFDDPYRFMPTLGDVDIHLIGEGRHEQLWTVLGAHVRTYPSIMGDVTGTAFAVWAPNARAVRVVGDFNHWDGVAHSMRVLGSSGIWELFVPGVGEGTNYKFEILCSDGVRRAKADPMARLAETAPATASKVTQSHYEWNDAEWMEHRARTNPHTGAMSTYEVHLGSWREGHSYRDLAEHLVNYVKDLGFTHVEFMPVMEHPYPPSWGYHVTSYYAPNSRFGNPDDFKFLVDRLHQEGIGVILDWVPGHFATDEWALARFDGQALYEHPDPRRGWHPEWGSNIFDYGRPQVRNFLVANALYWLEEFHADGLRVDGVASMLYLDYARKEGEWEPNKFGGRENLEAVQLLQETNATAYKRTPGAVIIAEESTSWPGITRPTNGGGLGFGLKWNMGWMHDALDYFANDPIYRQYHHNELTFAMTYAYSENYVLPISHDEVVHGKGSFLRKMPGDRWKQLANVRAFLAFQWAHPGKQLIFMGCEFAQEAEWADGRSLDWWLLDQPAHYGVHALVKDLNRTYTSHPALWQLDHKPEGFTWLNADDSGRNAYTWLRFAEPEADGYRPVVAVAVNLSGEPHYDVRVGLPHPGTWNELLNTDAQAYGGSGVGNLGSVEAEAIPWDGQPYSARVTMPPLGAVWLAPAERPAVNASTSETATVATSEKDDPTSSEEHQNTSDALLSGAPLEDQHGSAVGMTDGQVDEPVAKLGPITGTPGGGLNEVEEASETTSEDQAADDEEFRS